MLSPLRYPGGKAKLFPFFVELIRQNCFYDYTYCEPYAGGAGLALKLLAHGFVSNIEINDIDPAVAAFWRSVLGAPDRFCERISNVELSIGEWRAQREIYAKGPSGDDFALGFAAYYLNRTSRSGIIEGSGPIGGYAQEGKWTIDARFNRITQIKQVMEIARFADYINISEMDAIEVLDIWADRDNTFIYLDPPYYIKGHKLYKNFYSHDDHVAISQVLRKHYEKNWVLSYDCVDQIVGLYYDFAPLIYDLQYSAGKVGFGREVIFAGAAVRLPGSEFLTRAA